MASNPKPFLKAAQRYGSEPSFDTWARKTYNVSGPVLLAKVAKGESGFNMNAVSSAGARGGTQFMPGTRADFIRRYGVDPWASPDDAVHATKLYLQHDPRGLAGYNPGMPSYTKYILDQKVAVGSPSPTRAPVGNAPAGGGAPPAGRYATTTTRTTTTPGVDNSQLRRSLIADFLGSGGVKSTQATQQLAAGWLGAQDVPGTSSTATTRTPGQAAADVAASHSPLVADASSGRGGGGAHAALGWAQSKVGFHETGTNSGGLASYLNQRFGMSNQPWCAMFTSAAVTKGGAPAIARTASVAEVRRQAMQGGGGYQKGFVNPARAKGGDLITFGDDHIAMVKRVSNGRVYYVGGNQSDGVTESSVPVGHGDIVRPLYGARHRA